MPQEEDSSDRESEQGSDSGGGERIYMSRDADEANEEGEYAHHYEDARGNGVEDSMHDDHPDESGPSGSRARSAAPRSRIDGLDISKILTTKRERKRTEVIRQHDTNVQSTKASSSKRMLRKEVDAARDSLREPSATGKENQRPGTARGKEKQQKQPAAANVPDIPPPQAANNRRALPDPSHFQNTITFSTANTDALAKQPQASRSGPATANPPRFRSKADVGSSPTDAATRAQQSTQPAPVANPPQLPPTTRPPHLVAPIRERSPLPTPRTFTLRRGPPPKPPREPVRLEQQAMAQKRSSQARGDADGDSDQANGKPRLKRRKLEHASGGRPRLRDQGSELQAIHQYAWPQFRAHLICNPFEDDETYSDIAIRVWKHACETVDLNHRFTTTEKRIIFKLISQLRSRVKTAIDARIPAMYGLDESPSPAATHSNAERVFELLNDYRFCFRDPQNRKVMYGRPIFPAVLGAVSYHGRRPLAVAAPEAFKILPIGTLAFLCAMVHDSLGQWESGTFKQRDFNLNRVTATYRQFFESLSKCEESDPDTLDALLDYLGRSARAMSSIKPMEETPRAGPIFDDADYMAMNKEDYLAL